MKERVKKGYEEKREDALILQEQERTASLQKLKEQWSVQLSRGSGWLPSRLGWSEHEGEAEEDEDGAHLGQGHLHPPPQGRPALQDQEDWHERQAKGQDSGRVWWGTGNPLGDEGGQEGYGLLDIQGVPEEDVILNECFIYMTKYMVPKTRLK